MPAAAWPMGDILALVVYDVREGLHEGCAFWWAKRQLFAPSTDNRCDTNDIIRAKRHALLQPDCPLGPEPATA